MARNSQPPEPAPPALKESHNSARAKLLDRLTKGADLKARVVQSQEDAEAFNKDYKKWEDYNEALLTSLFTNDTPASLYRWSVSLGVIPYDESPHDKYQRNLYAIEKKCDHLESLIESLELTPLASGVAVERQPVAARLATDRVFVVHGHDAGACESVARLLERLGLSPVVLHKLPSGGKTIIEKLEHHADVDFAVVLLTPDDEGRSQGDPNLRPRARQNVLRSCVRAFG